MDALLDQIDQDLVILLDETDLANEDSADIEGLDVDERREMYKVLQQLRGLIQLRNGRGRRRLSLLTAGVASSIFTSSVRFGRDNQLFGFASARHLGPMSRDEMRQMIRTLGKRSGLKFDGHEIFDALFAEYGGHPHLTRQACARVAEAVHQRGEAEVPYRVSVGDLTPVMHSLAEGSPAHAAWETFVSFRRWYPEEGRSVENLLRTGLAADPAAVTHAVDFGLCQPDGSLRLGALRRAATREFG
jgi:hypothetical protein